MRKIALFELPYNEDGMTLLGEQFNKNFPDVLLIVKHSESTNIRFFNIEDAETITIEQLKEMIK